MESIPERPEDRDCWRLTRPLMPDESLPDHVCMATMRVSVAAWVRDYCERHIHSPLSWALWALEGDDPSLRQAITRVERGLDQLLPKLDQVRPSNGKALWGS
jgi:hypothetical protein